MNNREEYKSLPDRLGCFIILLIMLVVGTVTSYAIYHGVVWLIGFISRETVISIILLVLMATFALASVVCNWEKDKHEEG